MKINLPCVVIAPNKNKVYKSYIGCQERILSCRVLFHTVKPRFTLDTLLIRTPHFYGQFALSLGKQSPYILSKSNPLDTDTPLIRTLSMVPSVSVLTEFDCVLCTSHCTGTVIMQGSLYNMTPWIIPVFWHFPISWLYHQVDLKRTVSNISGKSNREPRVTNWFHCQPFYEKKKLVVRPFYSTVTQ